MFFLFVTKHACDGRTDGRTDGQNYDPQYRASIAASRGKNCAENDIAIAQLLQYQEYSN